MKSKKGEIITKEIVELLIAAAGIVAIILLFYNFIAPSRDVVEETSEAFFDIFVEQISVVDNGGVGEFSIWQEVKDAELFLIYFGKENGNSKRLKFRIGGEDFEPYGKYQYDYKNIYCMCSLKSGIPQCDYCANLASVAVLDNSLGGAWELKLNEKIKMKFENGFYNFTRIS